MGEETTALEEAAGGRSMAAPFIFFLVIAFHFASNWLERAKKKAGKSERAVELGAEIKQLLKEATALSGPSTFAQAAKLRRLAAAKEKELSNYQDSHNKEMKMSFDLYLQILFFSKVVVTIYFLLICWFWRTPVTAVSQQLVKPFGRVLTWWGGGYLNNTVMVGVVPWLVISTRVSRFLCRLIK